MKLVSMVEYVKRKHVSVIKKEITEGQFVSQVTNYANFLNRPLELSMFVPCDEEGNVLKEGQCIKNCNCRNIIMRDLNNQYNKAKERVLFEGFDYIEFEFGDWEIRNSFVSLGEWNFNQKPRVEYFINYHLILTESAIKQLK